MSRTVQIPEAGIYQVDVFLNPPTGVTATADAARLQQGLVAAWGLNGDVQSESDPKELTGQLVGGAQFVDSPIGKDGKAISLDGEFADAFEGLAHVQIASADLATI